LPICPRWTDLHWLCRGCGTFLLLLLIFLPEQAAPAACSSFAGLIRNGGVGVVDRSGTVRGCELDTPFIPASILKISTALVALQVLGPDYRFRTEFHVDAAGDLFIRGFGDPMLVSEEVDLIVRELRAKGLRRIRAIYIDPALFALDTDVPGRGDSDNPYDAAVGPVAVNFNTVALVVAGSGAVRSAEPQTPTLPLMRELGRGLQPGRYRLNICKGQPRLQPVMARYTAELFRAMFRRHDIACGTEWGIQTVPAGSVPFHVHLESRNLQQICAAMLRYSSNYIANLIFLAIGAQRFGYPATWAKARRTMTAELALLLGPAAATRIRQVDGAGLSRSDRITVRGMLMLLQAFRSHRLLLPERRGVRLKTGTLRGVYNLAGYLANGTPFVVLLNQPQNRRFILLDRLRNRYGGG